jgi:hypothetical protein
MSKKKKKYHIIYKTICKIDERYYIGMHSTYVLNDGYLGSGINLKKSVLKYGKENHTRTILTETNTRIQLQKKEKEIVNSKILKDPLCMNIMPGGRGGFPYKNRPHLFKKFYEAGHRAFKERIDSDPILRKRYQEYARLCGIKAKANGNLKVPDWNGRKHTEETKKKIGDASRIHQKGEGNSQYGKMWITNGAQNRKIRKNDEIPPKWRPGRVC